MADLYSSIVDLCERLLPIYNPSGYETEILNAVSGWLKERDISYSSDPRWGLNFTAKPPNKDDTSKDYGAQPTLLLLAHLDSDPYMNTHGLRSVKYERLQDGFEWSNGAIGLDCKTGVVMCLAIAEQVQKGHIPVSVRILLTVGEEIGQQGLLRMPETDLRAVLDGIRVAVALDRQSQHGTNVDVAGRPIPSPSPVRHVVNKYCGVPMVPQPESLNFAKLLAAATRHARMPDLPAVTSSNCSDILELRLRCDCELVLPYLLMQQDIPKSLKHKLETLRKEYNDATNLVMQKMAEALAIKGPGAPFGSFWRSPRKDRYHVGHNVSKAMYGPNVNKWIESKLDSPNCRLSVVNMSYDYSEAREGGRGSCSVTELMSTCRLVLSMLSYMPTYCTDARATGGSVMGA